jgi:hypothetical protein
LASASGSGATRDEEEIMEEEKVNDGAEGDDDEEDEEVFDVEEVNPTSYINMEHQFSGYLSTRIGGRKSATRAKQIW